MPRYSYKEELGLIDKNINCRKLIPYWCDACGSKLMYQQGAPTPQCPSCYAKKGLLVPMRQYFIMPGLNVDTGAKP